MQTVVGQKAIIKNDENKILLLLRSPKSGNGGKWSFAGGGLEEGEDPFIGIKREIEEETQLQVKDLKPYHLFSYIRDAEKFVVIAGYACTAVGDTVVLNWEHDDYRWVALEEAFRFNLGEHAALLLKEYKKICK